MDRMRLQPSVSDNGTSGVSPREGRAPPFAAADARGELLRGVAAELPLLLGVVPFGMIYGVLAAQAGLPRVTAQAASAIVFAGSSQFVMTQLVAGGASGLVIVLSIAAINARHALYSASVAPYLAHLSAAWKALLAYLLTDEAYAVSIGHLQVEGPRALRHFFLLGAGLTLWASWQVSTAFGLFIGARLPSSWSLEFTFPLMFIALVVPQLNDRAGLAAALLAGGVAVAAQGLPLGLGVLLAAVVGILAGTALERRAG
jgi:4-azaleucine resistance transporter AzlC